MFVNGTIAVPSHTVQRALAVDPAIADSIDDIFWCQFFTFLGCLYALLTFSTRHVSLDAVGDGPAFIDVICASSSVKGSTTWGSLFIPFASWSVPWAAYANVGWSFAILLCSPSMSVVAFWSVALTARYGPNFFVVAQLIVPLPWLPLPSDAFVLVRF